MGTTFACASGAKKGILPSVMLPNLEGEPLLGAARVLSVHYLDEVASCSEGSEVLIMVAALALWANLAENLHRSDIHRLTIHQLALGAYLAAWTGYIRGRCVGLAPCAAQSHPSVS